MTARRFSVSLQAVATGGAIASTAGSDGGGKPIGTPTPRQRCTRPATPARFAWVAMVRAAGQVPGSFS
jgi:hypothetical protein